MWNSVVYNVQLTITNPAIGYQALSSVRDIADLPGRSTDLPLPFGHAVASAGFESFQTQVRQF